MLKNIFPKNEHTMDRALRIVGGLGALSLVFVGPQTLWGLVGLLPLVTGIIGSCPAYTIFGVGTCSMKNSQAESAG